MNELRVAVIGLAQLSRVEGYVAQCTESLHVLDYGRFQQVARELGLPLRFGFTGAPAYTFDFFKVSTAYHHADCPTAEDLIPRLVQSGLIEIEVSPDEVRRRADLLRRAIRVVERG